MTGGPDECRHEGIALAQEILDIACLGGLRRIRHLHTMAYLLEAPALDDLSIGGVKVTMALLGFMNLVGWPIEIDVLARLRCTAALTEMVGRADAAETLARFRRMLATGSARQSPHA